MLLIARFCAIFHPKLCPTSSNFFQLIATSSNFFQLFCSKISLQDSPELVSALVQLPSCCNINSTPPTPSAAK